MFPDFWKIKCHNEVKYCPTLLAIEHIVIMLVYQTYVVTSAWN